MTTYQTRLTGDWSTEIFDVFPIQGDFINPFLVVSINRDPFSPLTGSSTVGPTFFFSGDRSFDPKRVLVRNVKGILVPQSDPLGYTITV